MHNLISKIKELAISISKEKKKLVSLNLLMGTLNFYPNGTIEFKTINSKSENKNRIIADNGKTKRDTSKEANIKSLLRTD